MRPSPATVLSVHDCSLAHNLDHINEWLRGLRHSDTSATRAYRINELLLTVQTWRSDNRLRHLILQAESVENICGPCTIQNSGAGVHRASIAGVPDSLCDAGFGYLLQHLGPRGPRLQPTARGIRKGFTWSWEVDPRRSRFHIELRAPRG